MKKLILSSLDLMPLGSRTTRLTLVIFALVTSNASMWQLSERVCNALLYSQRTDGLRLDLSA